MEVDADKMAARKKDGGRLVAEVTDAEARHRGRKDPCVADPSWRTPFQPKGEGGEKETKWEQRQALEKEGEHRQT